MGGDKAGSERTAIIVAAITGLLVAVAVFCFGYWENSHPEYITASIDRVAQLAILCLCPPSLALMAGDNLHGFQLLPLMAVIALLNAAWYVFLGLVMIKRQRVLPNR
jgi:hypothetical protein